MIKRKMIYVKKNKPHKHVENKYPPITSLETYQRTRKEQNALNRARSKSMENRVAKMLHGRRVLLSGAAAAYKGDVEVRFNNYPGGYIVECKLSAQTKGHDPYILLNLGWFPKIQTEAISMGSKFAVLIINFLGKTRDFVFVRTDIIEKLIHKYDSPLAPQLIYLLSHVNTIDLRYNKSNKKITATTLPRKILDDAMIIVNGVSGVKCITHDGEYLVIHIDTWYEAVKHM